MSPLDKVLDKLAKLKAHAESAEKIGNAAEAEAFAGMINRMLLQHELSIEDIPMKAEDDPILEHLVDPRKHGLKFSKSRQGWQETLAGIVARAHLCRIVVHPGTNYITLVGTKTHAAFAEHAYGVLAGAADRMSIKARDEYWRLHRDEPDFKSGNYRAAWLTGFITRIRERFDEAKRAEVSSANRIAQTAGVECTALIRLSGALARVDAFIASKNEAKEYGGKASRVKLGMGISKGFADGRKAADAMNLGQKAVQGGAATKKLGGGQ